MTQTTKKEQKVWKNIDWKDREEKETFFKKYFAKDKIVGNLRARLFNTFRDDLLSYIDEGKDITVEKIKVYLKR